MSKYKHLQPFFYYKTPFFTVTYLFNYILLTKVQKSFGNKGLKNFIQK